MAAEINYKSKYLELRSKYINDVDVAFRLGFEQGLNQAKQEQALSAQEQMAAAEQQNSEQQGQEEPSQEEQQQQQQEMQEQENAGSELDQHIGNLEQALQGSKDPEVQKSLKALIDLRKKEKFELQMKKSDLAVKEISKALHKPSFKMSTQAQHNMNDNAKKAVTLQHKIVNDIMKAWEKEETRASNDIKNILNIENLIKD